MVRREDADGGDDYVADVDQRRDLVEIRLACRRAPVGGRLGKDDSVALGFDFDVRHRCSDALRPVSSQW